MRALTTFAIVVSATLITFCEGKYSICDYQKLTFDSDNTATLEPSSYSQDSTVVNSNTVTFRTPYSSENVLDNQKCLLYIPGGATLQMNVVTFDLGGQDPCSAWEEHLSIAFYMTVSTYQYKVRGIPANRGKQDTIRWCGRSFSYRLETQKQMVLTYFNGVAAHRGKGFTISFKTVNRYDCGENLITKVGEHPMYVYSPGYPGVYSNALKDQPCGWRVRGENGLPLLVESLRFDVESHPFCNYDSLTIDRKRYCGDERIYLTLGSSFDMDLSSDHAKQGDGFVLRIVELQHDVASCKQHVVLGTSPVLLQLPNLAAGQFHSFNCWWLLDSGSDDKVVLLENVRYKMHAICSDFELSIYDGRNSTQGRKLFYACAPYKMFGSVRSSSRYLYVDIDVSILLNGPMNNTIDVLYTATTNPRDAVPRVLYADFIESYIWLNTLNDDDLGFMVRGSEESAGNYSTCLHLSLQTFPNTRDNSINSTDHLLVFSGWNSSFAELGRACGRASSEILISRGSKASVLYRSVYNRTDLSPAVWLVYRLRTRYCEPSKVRLQSTSRENGTIHSDKTIGSVSSNGYPSNLMCRWVIEPQDRTTFIQVTTLTLSVDPSDSITAYDYAVLSSVEKTTFLLRWSSGEPVIVSSEGSGLLLEFVTDQLDTGRGFSLNYTSVSLVGQCPSMAVLRAQERRQFLFSPNYPYNYPNGLDCRWQIQTDVGVVRLDVTYLNIFRETTACSSADYLVVYDGLDSKGRVLADLCGDNSTETSRSINSISGSVMLHFHSNLQNTASGFNLAFYNVSNIDVLGCNKEISVKEDVDSFVSSPNYPIPYAGNINCYWRVTAPYTHVVMLEVTALNLPCDSPALLYDGLTDRSLMLVSLCGEGHLMKRYVTTQNAMYISFRSAANPQRYTGFNFRLRSWKSDSGCLGDTSHLMAYTTKRFISSPGYPAHYPPNSDCQWRIESAYKGSMTVMVEIEDGQLESSIDCRRDSLSVYDGYGIGSPLLGKYCSKGQRTFWSSESYLFLRFVSDGSGNYRGFRLTYQAVSERPLTTMAPGQSSDDSSGSAGAIVGGVMGGVAFIVIGITVVLCSLRRCHRSPSSSSSSSSSRRRRRRRPNPSSEHSGSTVYVMNPIIVNQLSHLPPPPYPGLPGGSSYNDLPPAYSLSEAPPTPHFPFPDAGGLPPLPPPADHHEAPPSYLEAVAESAAGSLAGRVTLGEVGEEEERVPNSGWSSASSRGDGLQLTMGDADLNNARFSREGASNSAASTDFTPVLRSVAASNNYNSDSDIPADLSKEGRIPLVGEGGGDPSDSGWRVPPGLSVQGRSPSAQSQGRSAHGQGHSPQGRSRSPQGHSPQGRSRSPHEHGRSSQDQGRSPQGQSHSPHGQSRTAQGQGRSPQGHSAQGQGHSAQGRGWGQGHSAQGQGRSLKGQGRSPQGQGQSPQGQGPPQRPPPPPPPPLSSPLRSPPPPSWSPQHPQAQPMPPSSSSSSPSQLQDQDAQGHSGQGQGWEGDATPHTGREGIIRLASCESWGTPV